MKESCDNCGSKIIKYLDFHGHYWGHCITCNKEYNPEDLDVENLDEEKKQKVIEIE